VLPLALPLAPVAGSGVSAAAATLTAGSSLWLLRTLNEFRRGRPPLPPLTGRETEQTLAEMIRDAWAGAQVGVGSTNPFPQGPDPSDVLGRVAAAAAGIWAAWDRFGDRIGSELLSFWDVWGWLNRPKLPDTVLPYPGLGAGQTAKITTSPRNVTYKTKFKGPHPVGSNWVVVENAGGNWPTSDPWPGIIGYQITAVTASEAVQGELYGRIACNAELKISGRAADGRTGSSQVIFQMESGKWSFEVWPDETNQQGWVTTVNTAPATGRRPESLPEIGMATMPGLPGLLPVWPPIGKPGPEEDKEATEWIAPRPKLRPSEEFWDWKESLVPGTDADPHAKNEDGTLKKPTPGGTYPFPIAPWPLPGSMNRPSWYPGLAPAIPSTAPLPISPSRPRPVTTQPTSPAGKPIPTPIPGTPTTPEDSHFVDGVEIPGGSARPTLAGIAAEVQRIENKTARILQDVQDRLNAGISLGDLFDILELLRDLMQPNIPGGKYELSSPCVTVEGTDERIPIEVPFGEQPNVLAAILARFDAMAGLLQAHKDLKQPICEPPEELVGTPVRVRFRSDELSPLNGRRYRKGFTYRALGNATLVEHREHWRNFEWQSGPVQVISTGLPWGKPQIWAASAEEGKRVIAHAAAIAEVDLASKKHRWTVRTTKSARLGSIATMRVDRDVGGSLWVVTRTGSDGHPEIAPEHVTDPRVNR
jgi:hypothetical protein